jgi:hypothetical protein
MHDQSTQNLPKRGAPSLLAHSRKARAQTPDRVFAPYALLGWDATLWVLEANARGRCFWERRGWEPDGERRIEHGKVELRYRWRPRTGSAEGIT